MASAIDYRSLMHAPMRSMVAEILRDVSRNGLPGEHHFYIAVDTRHDGVLIPDWLREKYPREITLVLQHTFYNLSVDDGAFSLTLEFGGQPELLSIPFDAINGFSDPSVSFAIRLEEASASDRIRVVSESDGKGPAKAARGLKVVEAPKKPGAAEKPKAAKKPAAAKKPGVSKKAEVIRPDISSWKRNARKNKKPKK